MNASHITSQQLKSGFRGHLYNGRDFVGGVYLIDGKGYVLDVEYGRAKKIIAIHDPKDFRKAGAERLSESRSVTVWEVVA